MIYLKIDKKKIFFGIFIPGCFVLYIVKSSSNIFDPV